MVTVQIHNRKKLECVNSESNKIRAEKGMKQVIALRGFKVELMYFSAI